MCISKENSVVGFFFRENAVLSGCITTLKDKQKLDVSSEGPSSRVSLLIRVSAYFLR